MPWRKLIAGVLYAALGLVTVAGLWFIVRDEMNRKLGPPEIAGGVVQLTGPQARQLAWLSTQWETRYRVSTSRTASTSRRASAELHLDYWLFDADRTQPTLRVRLRTSDSLGDVKALGLDGDVLWARTPELLGVRVSDGAIVADRARVAAANPELAELLPQPPAAGHFLPDGMQRIRFTPKQGLVLQLDDGRRVQVNAKTLKAQLLPTADAAVGDASTRRAVTPLAHGNQWTAMVRGQQRHAQGWLGLVAPHELEPLAKTGQIAATPDFSRPERLRLYPGRVEAERTWMGSVNRLKLQAPLPEAPEFLFAGLAVVDPLAEAPKALVGSDPESLFVLHLDRLGDAGRWQLSRVNSASGRVLWNATLPLSFVGLWWPGGQQALVMGLSKQAPTSNLAEEREAPPLHIVGIDLASGAQRLFSLDAERDWPATPAPR